MNLNLNNKKIKILTDFKSKLEMFNLNKEKISIFKKLNLDLKFEFINLKKIKKKYIADIYWGTRINNNILNKCLGLKWIHLGSVGVDKLNLDNLKKKKILLSNSKGINSESVSNLIIFFLLDTSKKILLRKKINSRIDYEPYFIQGKDLKSQKICVLGFGNISKKLKNFFLFNELNYNILSQRKLKIPNVINYKSFNSRVKNYDTIISLLPLNKKNREFLNFKLFNKMKKNVNLILVGRSSTVNLHNLYSFLKKNKKSTCYLDAVPDNNNKFVFKKLKKLKNVFITPHIGGYFRNYWKYQTLLFKQNLLLFVKQKKIKNLILN